jgi:cyclophilin family peptidyl-prolyl cis-trans isomerase
MVVIAQSLNFAFVIACTLRRVCICCCALQAVENFLALCKGVEVGGRALSYTGTPFTRVVKRFVVQAGDVVNKDGTGRRGGGGKGGSPSKQ